MIYQRPVRELIEERFSCRIYLEEAIGADQQQKLREYMQKESGDPFHGQARFELVAADEQDSKALRGLSTYGFIQGGRGFIVGAMTAGEKDLEAYGYRLEEIILYATGLGLGTCWLGGTFSKSNFAKKIKMSRAESLPAVAAIGRIADEAMARQTAMRQRIGADSRLAWETLFLDGKFGAPLAREKAGDYAMPLEMVRLAPSASNKQPWRVIWTEGGYHFYMQRTKGYRSPLVKLAGVADMQRVDMGIAMCHFELAVKEAGLGGQWVVKEPEIQKQDELTEYSVSWVMGGR